MLLMIYIPIREKVEPTRAFFTLIHGLSTHSSFVKGQAFSEVSKNYDGLYKSTTKEKFLLLAVHSLHQSLLSAMVLIPLLKPTIFTMFP